MHDGDLAWLELPGGDDCRLTGGFYARACGWLVDDDGETVWFREPSGRIGGAFRSDLAPAATGPLLYLSVADATATLERITAHGGVVVQDRMLIAPGVGHRALFRDPAGSTLGLFEPEAGT